MIEQSVDLLPGQPERVQLVEQAVRRGHDTAGANASHLEMTHKD